jgi:hypothetical protein
MDRILNVSETRFTFHIDSLEKPTLLTLKLRNEANDHVGFKVKTTRPKRYCVKPNAAKLAPGETLDLQVQLQPLKRVVADACAALVRQAESRSSGGDATSATPAADVLTYDGLKQELSKELKDKFLIQALLLKNRSFDAGLFDTVDREEVFEQKFRCEFLFSQDTLENVLQSYRARMSQSVDSGGKSAASGMDAGTPPASASAQASERLDGDTVRMAGVGAGGGSAAAPSVHWDDAATEQSKAAAAAAAAAAITPDHMTETETREESETARLRRELARSQAEVALLKSRLESASRLLKSSSTGALGASPHPTLLILPWVQLVMAILLGILLGKYVLAA